MNQAGEFFTLQHRATGEPTCKAAARWVGRGAQEGRVPSGAKYTRPRSPYWPSMCRSFCGFCPGQVTLSAHKCNQKDLQSRRRWTDKGADHVRRYPANIEDACSAAQPPFSSSPFNTGLQALTEGQTQAACTCNRSASEQGVCSVSELPASTPRRLYASCKRLSFFFASSLFTPLPAPAGPAASSPVAALLPQGPLFGDALVLRLARSAVGPSLRTLLWSV